MTTKTVFSLPIANGDTLVLDELGTLCQQTPQGEPIFLDVLHWSRVDRILAAKTAKRAENLIRMARKTNHRKQRQYLRRKREGHL